MAVDWNEVRDEVTRHLQALLRINTVNPPGNETEAAQYLAGIAREAGIPCEIVEGAPGRGNLVARLSAGSPAGRPVILLGHTDVVGVERDKWTHDPFGGEVSDGFVWGRGAIDMKNQVAANLMVLLLLKREGVALGRDVIMAATADEEAGSVLGAYWLWEHRRDLVDAEYGITEVGGQPVEIAGRRFYTVQVGEKGGARMRITARAAPGHASVPRDDTAIARLGRALVRLHEFEPPTIITEPVARMLRLYGAAHGPEAAERVEAILRHPTWPALAALPMGEMMRLNLRATTHNTAVPTILGGGHRINVIPSEVWVDVDGRVLPGQDPADWIRQVQAAVGDEVEVRMLTGGAGVAADPASPFFDAIAATIDAEDPGAGVLPYLMSGGTDARAMPGVKIYGFMPSRSGADVLALAHGHDERTRVDDLLFGTRCLYGVVTRFAGA
ncbi:MAG: M20/M25/M40 family metallo-hydrolase, partial [Chloroflexota bacterium]|nr:M20/M25/M40 family metallo-hydrolase [Chloroflexota bacterium]